MGSSESGRYRDDKMTAAQRRQALVYHANGWTVLEVAHKYEVSPQYIYQLLKPRKKKSL